MLATEHRIGLRFDPADWRRLVHLAQRAQARELATDAISLFTNAAEACTNNEPLIVVCTSAIEAVLIAKAFVRYGIHEPTLEQTRA